MRIIFFSLFLFSNIVLADYLDYIYKDRYPSFNSFGQVGLIQTPSANTKGEDSIHLILNNNLMWKYGSLTVTPFNWLEASYFYYRPRDLAWEVNKVRGDYLDKGFNVKFAYKPKNKSLPSLAVGLDDIGGTGYFAREYLASTFNKEAYNLTVGIGWGKFNNISSFSNPLRFFNKEFENRGSSLSDQGGTFATDTWFRGNASLFGGVEFYLPKMKGVKLKIEHDPFDYLNFSAQNRDDADQRLRKKNSNLNVGFSIPVNDYFTIETSFIKGNAFNLSFVIGKNFNQKKIKKTKFEPEIKENPDNSRGGFYKDLVYNLNNNKLFLQTADIDEKKKELNVAITHSDYVNQIRASSYAAEISRRTYESHNLDINKITISNINVGIETSKVSYFSNHLGNKKIPKEVVKNYTNISSGDKNSFKDNRFKPDLKLPISFNSITPNIINHIGSPDKFYFGGLVIQNTNETIFKRNLILTSNIILDVVNNFDETPDRPFSKLPSVRTDVVKYLQGSNTVYIDNMQLDYFFTPVKNVYARLSGGILERMYSGAGFEVLHKPFDKNFYWGFESFYVKKRDFDMLFSNLDYKTQTSHINFNYFFESSDINLNLSYGKYLAKDIGYTFDLSRISKLGIKSGFFFTRTDVPAAIFGEGSFDKGFYIQVPLNLFNKNYTSATTDFTLRPLTRDGGAKLNLDKSLKGLMFNTNLYEFNRDWSGFLD
tara:strand:- start:4020 stop:6149 length:2130 start_codon:yes stop_codon:yes gene_type:complete